MRVRMGCVILFGPSTKVGNKADARVIESAYRTKLAKGEVGIEEPKQIPSLYSGNERLSRVIFMVWGNTILLGSLRVSLFR
jgi:hypothetical protein